MKSTRKVATLCAFLALASWPSAAWTQSPQDTTFVQGLKDVYKGFFTVGVAVNQRNVSDEEQMALIRKEFNSVTAENDMKPGELHPKEGVWRWEKADRIANFCRQNGIKMRGHCLCWHAQFADWMFIDKDGKPATKELFYQRLREHIHTVVTRYKDVVYCWDVVNEAIADNAGNGESPYRQTRHYELCGDEFIAKAFEYAHEADPEATLFYNDYSTVEPGKRERIYRMVKKMKTAGVPIGGIGMQGHYNVHFPTAELLDQAISRFSELVSNIHITELDVRLNSESGGQLNFSRGDDKPQSEQQQLLQSRQYGSIFQVLRKHRDVIGNVTFWNLSDRDSWLGVDNHPLPFDEQYRRKPCYDAIVSFGPTAAY
jgi:GH35 family endo-1,4-beta-xylanase